jgi:hypothetical protein
MRDREPPPNRRPHVAFNLSHDGKSYHCSASHYPDGRISEIFINVGKAGSELQLHAETCAILASIALQFGVPVQTIIHAVQGGPLAAALELAVQP